RILAPDLATTCLRAFHRADSFSRHQTRRLRGRVSPAIRSERLPHAVSGWRALRSGHAGLGGATTRRARDRSLVADGNWLAHRRELRWPRVVAGQTRLV